MNERKPFALIVEDEPFWSAILERLLSQIGITSVVAPDAAKARDLLGDAAFDLILIDLVLPGQEGLELLAEVRQRPELASRSIVVTAHSRMAGYFGREIPIVDKGHPSDLIPHALRILDRAATAG